MTLIDTGEKETKTLAEIGGEDQARKASYYGHAIDDLAKWLQAQQ